MNHGGVALIERYDALILDLDGVIYVGNAAVAHASESVVRAVSQGIEVWFATNNASRTSEDIAAHLNELGCPATPEQVVVASAVAADIVRHQFSDASTVNVVGTDALAQYFRNAGFLVVMPGDRAVDGVTPLVDIVVQGHNPETGWRDLTQALRNLVGGATWVATNDDLTIPLAGGLGVGNGAMVAALARASGRLPDLIVGKPHPWMFDAIRSRSSAHNFLMVGDRLDTDIAWANNTGCDSLLVRTGVDAMAVPGPQVQHRPTWVADDLRGLFAAGLPWGF